MQEQVRLFNSLPPAQQQSLIRELQRQLPPAQREAVLGMLQGCRTAAAAPEIDAAAAAMVSDVLEAQIGGAGPEAVTITYLPLMRAPSLKPFGYDVFECGLSFAQMRDTINERIAQQMIGLTASITLGELRSIRVFVLGDAVRPGSYTVSSLATVTNALLASGGVKPVGVPLNVDRPLARWSAITQIVYNLAIAPAAVNSF
jgi:hypothetical protein